MFKFEALSILLKSLFEKTASVVTIYNTPSLSTWCVSSGNSIFGLLILDTNLVVSGPPKAYRINANGNFKILAAIVHCPEKNNTLQFRDCRSLV